MKRQLLKGNEALCRAAMDAGCSCFFGYPITPQNQVPEYLSQLMPEAGRVFVQAESEVAAINMVYGAASVGVRVMTSSSSPGISLKQEGISYLAGAELPAVIVNVMRGGPGLGNIAPAQSRLLPGHARRRARRLSHAGARAVLGTGDVSSHPRCLRAGGKISQPGDDPRRCHPRANDGAGAHRSVSRSRYPRRSPGARAARAKARAPSSTHFISCRKIWMP